MRAIELFESLTRTASPELTAWLVDWIESPIGRENDLYRRLQPLIKEAASFHSFSITEGRHSLYRGMCIAAGDAERLRNGETITIPAKPMQSWTSSRKVAEYFSDPAGGDWDFPIVVKQSVRTLPVLVEVDFLINFLPTGSLSGDIATDAKREHEVIVGTNGRQTIEPKNAKLLS